jgi:hypothetical protein
MSMSSIHFPRARSSTSVGGGEYFGPSLAIAFMRPDISAVLFSSFRIICALQLLCSSELMEKAPKPKLGMKSSSVSDVSISPIPSFAGFCAKAISLPTCSNSMVWCIMVMNNSMQRWHRDSCWYCASLRSSSETLRTALRMRSSTFSSESR